ncbi:TcdA/TcdB pore-forming domain-containing protein [Providencia alcalifaciens]|uniref:TcdA/TcdB pore-forming domain-containing protein n=1 Tax=Providencia alcalifaciens TaxID=126385 RepID=UPI001CC3407A|nr:TcdA/TcdB pore-forming domain-containing protein [Providencia alcalifaciens]CAG9426536.1 hypothetical protein NVI2019_GHJFPKLH_02680 [Providencia alcalifaciens]
MNKNLSRSLFLYIKYFNILRNFHSEKKVFLLRNNIRTKHSQLGYKTLNVSPKIITQTLCDCALKSPLWWRTPTSRNSASPDIAQFKDNSILFSHSSAISGDSIMKMGKLPSNGLAQFTKIAPHIYAIELAKGSAILNSDLTVNAYFLGYNGANQSNRMPAYVDIPIQAAEDSFLFTGGLSGCSIIVTKHDDSTYRVYHDGRVNSSILYDNVVMAFDFQDYQVAGTAEGLALVYMRYKEGQWELILQRQEYKIIDVAPIPHLREQGEIISQLYPNNNFSHLSLERFNNYRNEVHKKIIVLGKNFNIDISNIKDEVYLGGDFSSEHPAIQSWVGLNNKIKQKINDEKNHINEKIDRAKKEIDELNKSASSEIGMSYENRIRKDEINEIINMNKNLREYYKQRYDPILSELLSVERSWLWLQIKNYHGEKEVIHMEGNNIKTGMSSNNLNLRNQFEIILNNDIWKGSVEFDEGIGNYKSINIKGFNHEMPLLEMQKLYINGGLKLKERGALSQYIKIKEQSDYIKNILDLTSQMDTFFQKSGSVQQRVAPQDFYLPLMEDDSGGRCYPLVRAMSVALALDGDKGADELLNKMFLAAASPKEKSSVLLRSSLQNLHSNIQATEASSSVGLLDLTGIEKVLTEGEAMKMYALNTQTHSMLIGKLINSGKVYYYFYDPNFGIYTFDNHKKLFSALNHFMNKKKMAYKYDALIDKSKPIFELIAIDVEKMANVGVGSGLNVGDMVSSTELSEVAQRHQDMKVFLEKQNTLMEDRQIKTSLCILNAEQWGARLESSVNKINQLNQLDENWLPVFASTDKLDSGRYRVQFIHRDDEEVPRWIETEDATFFEFKQYFNESIATFRQHYTFDDLELQHEDISEGSISAEHVDGLNSAIGIKALIEWSANRNRQSVASGSPSNLNTALRIHAYVSYTMMAHGALNDISRVTQLASTLWKDGAAIVKTEMNSFSSSLLRTANEGVGAMFQGAMVGFDIYELANVENEQQSTVIGTRLAFDSAALTTSIVGYGASILGAETVAGVAMPLAVPLTGLGIGVAELVRINERHAYEAAEVGAIFTHYKESYQNAAISYHAEKKLLIPTNGIVIEGIDFLEETFTLGSQYIYRGEKRSWTIGHSALSDFQSSPRAEVNKNNAINVREAVGIFSNKVSFDSTQSNIIVLPAVPKSYINYKYSSLFGGTSRGDNGYSILRDMEENYQFYFDYFYCGLEYVISELKFEYVFTPINIKLDSDNKHLIIPTLPDSWHSYIEYDFIGYGGEYQISVNHGSNLKLKQSPLLNHQSTWVIDTSFIDNHQNIAIEIMDDRIEIGSMSIYVDDSAKLNVIRLVNSQQEMTEINFKDKTVEVISLNGMHWNSEEHSIESFIKELEQKGELHRQYVVVNHYQLNGINVGRAFYNSATDRMFYTNSINKENQSAILVCTVGDDAYFYSEKESIAWVADIHSRSLKTRFDFIDLLEHDAKIEKMGIVNNVVCLEITRIYRGSKINLSYRMVDNQLELYCISNDVALMAILHKTKTVIPPQSLKHSYLAHSNTIGLSQEYIDESPLSPLPKLAKMVMIKNTDHLGIMKVYWLRTGDGVLIKPNLERPYNHDQVQISNLSPSLHWFSSNPNELAYMDRQLANRIPFEEVIGNNYVGFMNRHELLEIEGLFLVSRATPSLSKIVGTRFKRFDPLTDTWNWEPPTDLTLVGSLFDDNGGEVFFFYSQNDDTIFRQEGPGQEFIDLHNPTAKRLGLSEIETVFSWQGNLLVLHKNGVVKQLKVNGSADVVALNKLGSDNKPVDWNILNNFINEPHPITLLGLKDKEENQLLSAWYFKGQIIINKSPLPENTLQFLGFDQHAESGIIFDTQTKKLYQQKAISSTQLAEIFSDNAVLQLPESLPNSIDLYPTIAIKNVQKIGDGLMILTVEGQIIFHPLSNQSQFGSSLVMKGTDHDDILAPTQLKDVQTLILSGGEGKDTYHLNMEDWQRHQAIIINNQSQDKAVDYLVLPIKAENNSIFVNRLHSDLIITDSINQTSLVLHNIYGSNELKNRHLMIQFEDRTINISDLANTLNARHGAMYLASYFENKSQCNDNLDSLADSCSQFTSVNDLSPFQETNALLNQHTSEILPVNAVQHFLS